MLIRDVMDGQVIEQLSVVTLVIGLVFVFQWWMQAIFVVGLILLALGSIGTLASQIIQGRHIIRTLERMTVIGMMVGIVGMLQSWQIALYENGFYLLLIATVGFIVLSHINTSEA